MPFHDFPEPREFCPIRGLNLKDMERLNLSFYDNMRKKSLMCLEKMENLKSAIPWQLGKVHLLMKVMWYDWKPQDSY